MKEVFRALMASSNIVGDKSIAVWAGDYWPASLPLVGVFFRTSVSIFWGFDEDGKLIEIYARQSHGG